MVVAGGTESMSLVPMGGHKVAPNPTLLERYPDSYLGMGLTAERVAQKYGIDRERSDAFALRSHQQALAAIAAGKFKDEIVPLEVSRERQRPGNVTFDTDEGPRKDTDAAALAKLKPAFAAEGIVTAGNASQMSDGAAAARRDVRGEGEGAGAQAPGPLRHLRGGRGAARDHGHRPGGGDPQGPEAGRA